MYFQELIQKADKVFHENFDNTTCFERAIFFSWYCSIKDCAFCFMSTHENQNKQEARRSQESILAEAIICKNLGWPLGFFSGGIGVYTFHELHELIKNLYSVYGEKFWLNIGPIPKQALEMYKPYIKGVIGSIETVDKELHKKVCPSKPVEPYLKMFTSAKELGLKLGMTFITGLGETLEDYPKLKEFIKENNIEKIHVYGLNPVKGTLYENAQPPTPEYQAEWIARLRIDFPKLDIQMGIWTDKVDRISLCLKAGANSISKFPAIRKFNSNEAKELVHQAELAGRIFKGHLMNLPEINWEEKLKNIDINTELKQKIKIKLDQYIRQLQKKRFEIENTQVPVKR